jgi:hypothetical protein
MGSVRTTNHPVVGRVRWRPLDGGAIEILDDWVEQNILTIEIPQLKSILAFGKPFNGLVRFYKGAVEQLRQAWEDVERHRLLDRVLSWDGSFVPRLVRGSTSRPSNHAFGTAFDINARWNGLGVTPPPAGVKGSVRELVPIFEKYGFFWGGNYRHRPDGMHFEVVRLGEPEETEAFPSLEVFVNGVQQVIPALLIDGSAWVGIRAWTKVFGGTITQTPAGYELRVGEKRKQLTLHVEGKVGYCLFSEIVGLYGCSYQLRKEEMRLEVWPQSVLTH